MADPREKLEEIQRDLDKGAPGQFAALAPRVATLDDLLSAEERRQGVA